MDRLKKADTQNIITIEDCIDELNKLYVEMTYEVDFYQGAIKNNNVNAQQLEIQKEILSTRKYIDDTFKNDSTKKLKYLIGQVKEMLITIPNESDENAKIKNVLFKRHKKIFAEIIKLMIDFGFIDIDELEFSDIEMYEIFDSLESLDNEKKILDEIENSKSSSLKDVTLLTDESKDEIKYGMFIKDNSEPQVIFQNETGSLTSVSTYKAFQSEKNEETNGDFTPLLIKKVTKYEMKLKEPNGEILSIVFFGNSDIKKQLSMYGIDYLKALYLALLAARRNKSVKMKHIGSIEKIDEKIFRTLYDENLEKSIKQLINKENKASEQNEKNTKIERDE